MTDRYFGKEKENKKLRSFVGLEFFKRHVKGADGSFMEESKRVPSIFKMEKAVLVTLLHPAKGKYVQRITKSPDIREPKADV